MRFGIGASDPRVRVGVTIFLTLGTGTGSAIFNDGVLVPNSELGHMEIRGKDAERRSAAAARVRRGESWKYWAGDLDEHLKSIDRILWPRFFILGGGVSKQGDRFIPRLTCRPPVMAATLRNEAGIVGAALLAGDTLPRSRRTRAARPSRPWARRRYARSRSGFSTDDEPDTTRLSPATSRRSSGGLASYFPGPVTTARAKIPSRRRSATVRPSIGPPGSDLELLHREGELAVRQRRIDEVGDPRPERQLGDPPAGHRVGRHDPVGARLEHFRLAAVGVGPADEEDRPG